MIKRAGGLSSVEYIKPKPKKIPYGLKELPKVDLKLTTYK